ncbi:unnamed protein product [Polarella glacialis]|uniref:Phosphatidate phosphatase APP1 catalytic domain-containing protein n=1 Tax=Polarella glacialis TaxID=89957 RepID=A0A813HD01_POLGL|nr:unnamed protein product [Polarella glacialis]
MAGICVPWLGPRGAPRSIRCLVAPSFGLLMLSVSCAPFTLSCWTAASSLFCGSHQASGPSHRPFRQSQWRPEGASALALAQDAEANRNMLAGAQSQQGRRWRNVGTATSGVSAPAARILPLRGASSRSDPGAGAGTRNEGQSNFFYPLQSLFSSPQYGIVAHDACARQSGDGWIVPIEAWVFRSNAGRHKKRLMLCMKILMEGRHGIRKLSDAERQRYEERGRLVLRNVGFRGAEKGRQLEFRFVGQNGKNQWRTLPVDTNEGGRISTEIYLSASEVEELSAGTASLQIEVRGAGSEKRSSAAAAWRLGSRRPGKAHVHLAEERGLSVISDVDDTVKVTKVFAGKDVIVRNTFFKEYQAVEGMADLFQSWSKSLPGMSFHFVSNSPPEILEPLREFLDEEGFPRAPMHLRPLTGNDRENFKVKTVETILKQMPHRKFILIGDSGESDAKIYAELMRRFPQQVVKILIRQVHRSRAVEQDVFAGLDPSSWQVFKVGSDVDLKIEQLAVD